MTARRRLVLVGAMGTGKTTVGRALAARLGWRYWDNDVELSRESGLETAELLATVGADELHLREARVLLEALREVQDAVIAAAASVVDDPACRTALHQECCVWLRGRPETLAARVARDPARPFLHEDPLPVIRRLVAARAGNYADVSTITVDVDDVAVDALVERIVALLPQVTGVGDPVRDGGR